jgi:hypothetical protein
MYKKTVYTYLGNTYDNFDKIKKLLPNISWPLNPTDAQLESFDIQRSTIDLDLQETKTQKIAELYAGYEAERDRPTEYKVGDTAYYFDRLEADINKFNSAYNVALLKGENGYGVKNAEGVSLWVMLSASDFQSVLVKSAAEQSAAYNRFYSLRNKVNASKSVSAVKKIKWTSKI